MIQRNPDLWQTATALTPDTCTTANEKDDAVAVRTPGCRVRYRDLRGVLAVIDERQAVVRSLSPSDQWVWMGTGDEYDDTWRRD